MGLILSTLWQFSDWSSWKACSRNGGLLIDDGSCWAMISAPKILTYIIWKALWNYTFLLIQKKINTLDRKVPWLDALFCTESAGTGGSLWWCVISTENVEFKMMFKVQCTCSDDLCICSMHARAYHPHFGEVNETFLSEIGRPLLNKGQVC